MCKLNIGNTTLSLREREIKVIMAKEILLIL